jgi:hypothetical protein
VLTQEGPPESLSCDAGMVAASPPNLVVMSRPDGVNSLCLNLNLYK